jgi:iron-sulfur cluster repair protein YtfE (RIC family)
MKATQLLEQQHRKVAATFARLASLEGDPAELVRALADDLAAHMAVEQQLFYPMVREFKAELVDDSYEEHSIAELALKRLVRASPGDPMFRARVVVLRELIETHVEHEERQLFPAVEKELGDAKLEALGVRLQRQFEDAKAQGFEALVPAGFTRTSADEFERFVQAT